MNLRQDAEDLIRELERLASSLEGLSLPGVPGDDRLRRRRDWVVATIRDYLIPRASDPSSPMLVVFAGPTGAGKSTLLNSVVGAEHSPTGPLRPTTDRPLVVTTEAKADRYRRIGGAECTVVTGRAPILRELALVDTPDIDSTVTEHRAVAEAMIDHADIVVFVTSAIRYGDRVPWEVLRRAHSRSVPVIHVLNRLARSSSGALADYSGRLVAEGLGGHVVPVHEHHMRPGARSLPVVVIQELRDRLVELVEARRSGAADVFKRVLDSVVDQSGDIVDVVAGHLEAWSETRSRLHREMEVDLERVLANLRPVRPDHLNLDQLAMVAARPIRTRRAIRRRLPDPQDVASTTSILAAALVLAIDADVLHRIDPYPMEGELAGLIDRVHSHVELLVGDWLEEIGRTGPVAASVDPPLTALLLAAACLALWPDQPVSAVWESLAGADLRPESCLEVTGGLERRLRLLYQEIEDRLLAALGPLPESGQGVESAREAITGVVARASFADA